MNTRIVRLREQLAEPLLVTAPVNVRYLTGLDSSNAALLVEPDRLRLFTDFRYREKASGIDGAEVVEIPRNLYSRLPAHLAGRIGFEAAALTYAQYAALSGDGIELVPRTGLVEGLRAVKDAGELDAIRRAAAITNAMFEQLPKQRFVGRTERNLAWWAEKTLRGLGAEAPAFDLIVAAGPNGAQPHADTGDRVIEAGQLVVVDAGARVDGYCSDCTRTFATGKLPQELVRAYAVCRRAQEASLEAYRPGAAAREVDAVAREVIAAEGLGELFGHGLGHGVGLRVHELPRVRPESEDVLQAGNVVSCEPGIYQPGVGGVRIEDLVIVTDDGPEVLSPFTKELVTVR